MAFKMKGFSGFRKQNSRSTFKNVDSVSDYLDTPIEDYGIIDSGKYANNTKRMNVTSANPDEITLQTQGKAPRGLATKYEGWDNRQGYDVLQEAGIWDPIPDTVGSRGGGRLKLSPDTMDSILTWSQKGMSAKEKKMHNELKKFIHQNRQAHSYRGAPREILFEPSRFRGVDAVGDGDKEAYFWSHPEAIIDPGFVNREFDTRGDKWSFDEKGNYKGYGGGNMMLESRDWKSAELKKFLLDNIQEKQFDEGEEGFDEGVIRTDIPEVKVTDDSRQSLLNKLKGAGMGTQYRADIYKQLGWAQDHTTTEHKNWEAGPRYNQSVPPGPNEDVDPNKNKKNNQKKAKKWKDPNKKSWAGKFRGDIGHGYFMSPVEIGKEVKDWLDEKVEQLGNLGK